MRRLLVTAILIVTAGLAYRLFGQSAEPRALWPVKGRVLSALVADDRWIGWLEKDETASRLVVGPLGGGPSRTVLSADSLSGLAIEGDRAFVAQAAAGPGGDDGALVEVRLPEGGAESITGVVVEPDEIVASGGWIVWRSTRESALPGIPFVVAAAPLRAIQACRPDGGPVHTLAVLKGGDGASNGTYDLLGVLDGHAYWAERNGSGTAVRTRVVRTPCEGGDLDTVVEERGSRTAALEDNVLVWTAPSIDAGAIDSHASVKRLRIGDPRAEVIADWLEPRTVVLLSRGTAYAYDNSGLWRLGGRRGDQRRLFAGRVRGTVVSGDQAYLVMGGDRGSVVVARPLTWWARIKAAVTP